MRQASSVFFFFLASILSANTPIDNLLDKAKDNFNSNWLLSTQFVDSAYSLSLKSDYKLGLVRCTQYYGWIEHKSNDIAIAIRNYLKVIELTEGENDPEFVHFRIYANMNAGNILSQNGAGDIAVDYYLDGIELARLSRSEKEELSLMRNLHVLYRESGNFNEAIKLAHEILQRTEVYNDKYFQMLMGLAITHRLNSNNLESEYYLLKILKEARMNNKVKFEAIALHNLGDVYFELGEFQRSKEHFTKAIELKETHNLGVVSEHSSYRDIAKTLTQLGLFDQAKQMFLKSEKYLASISNCSDCASRIYPIGIDIARALNDETLLERLQKSYKRELEIMDTENLRIKYESKQPVLRLIVSNYYSELESQKNLNSAKSLVTSILIGVCSLIVLLLGYHNYVRLRNRKIVALELKNLDWIDV